MRLLIVTTSYPRRNDGTEAAGSFVEDFAIALSKICSIAVVAPGLEVGVADTTDTFDIYRFRSPERALSTLNPLNPLHWVSILSTLVSGQRTCHQAVEEFKPNHILALWALPSGYWAARAGKAYNIPYSTWALGSDIWSLGKIPLVRSILKKTLTNAKIQFADGFQLSQDVSQISGKPCHFLPSTRQLNKIDRVLRTSPPYRLSFLGRWHPNKGVDILLDALELLSDDDWGKIESVRIEGGGPLHGLVHEKAHKLSAAGRPVTVGAYLNKEDAQILLVNTDFLIISSRIESIPVVFSDAMQSRCPVIVTPVGDLPKLIGEYGCGVLSGAVSAFAISVAIREALGNVPCVYKSELDAACLAFDIQSSANACTKLFNSEYAKNID